MLLHAPQEVTLSHLPALALKKDTVHTTAESRCHGRGSPKQLGVKHAMTLALSITGLLESKQQSKCSESEAPVLCTWQSLLCALGRQESPGTTIELDSPVCQLLGLLKFWHMELLREQA